MLYVGSTSRLNNSIGAAFSNDGIAWTKYPQPVILSTTSNSLATANLYGVGQPAAYNADGGSNITLFYEDVVPQFRHVKATSTDGVHFTVQGDLTTKGLDP